MSKFSGVPLGDLNLHPNPEGARGLRVAVIGGTGGLGRALARSLASRGARVTVVGQTFRDEGTPGLDFVQGDLSSMANARRVARDLPAEELDVVVFTSGIITAATREETAEGIERDLAISYLSRFEILRGIADRLGTGRADRSRRPRVFVMGFPGTGEAGNPDDLNAEAKYEQFPQHMNTVAGNEALVLEGARRWPHLGIYGLNPGLVKTDIRSNMLGKGSWKFAITETLIGWFTPSAETYGERLAPVLLATELEGRTAIHLNQKGVAIRPSAVMDEARARKFWDVSEALLAKRAVA